MVPPKALRPKYDKIKLSQHEQDNLVQGTSGHQYDERHAEKLVDDGSHARQEDGRDLVPRDHRGQARADDHHRNLLSIEALDWSLSGRNWVARQLVEGQTMPQLSGPVGPHSLVALPQRQHWTPTGMGRGLKSLMGPARMSITVLRIGH